MYAATVPLVLRASKSAGVACQGGARGQAATVVQGGVGAAALPPLNRVSVKNHRGLLDERLSPSAATPRRPARYSAPRPDALLRIKNVARSLQVHVQHNVWGEAGAWVSAPRQASLQHAPPAVFCVEVPRAARLLQGPPSCTRSRGAREEGPSVCSYVSSGWVFKELVCAAYELLGFAFWAP